MSAGTRAIRVVNPATEEEVAGYDEHSSEEIEQAIADAHHAQRQWRDVAFDDRARIIRAMAAVMLISS